MQPLILKVPRSAFRDPETTPIGVAVGRAVATAIAAGLMALSIGAPAMATPSESLPAPQASTTTTIVTTPADFSATGYVRVMGAKLAGSSIVVSASTGDRICSIEKDASATWDCGTLLLRNGPNLTLTATESAADSSTPAPEPATTSVDVLGPPVMDGNGSYLTTGLVSGIGYAGSLVTVSVNGEVDANCATVPVSANTLWSCNLAAPSGSYAVRSQQSNSSIGAGHLSGYSGKQDITVDRDAPASAVITAPLAGSRVATQSTNVTGSGENGARVDVYVDSVPKCTAAVVRERWACSIGAISRGRHLLQAVQRDAAGNFGQPSDPISVDFGSRPVPAPGPAPAVPSNPGTPAPPETALPMPVPSPGPSMAVPLPPGDRPIRPGPDGSAPTVTEALTNWGTPTSFGDALPGFGSAGSWYWAVALALVFLALVALPLRLVSSALRGRIPHGRLTGRNQGRPAVSDADVPRPVNPWFAGAVPLAAAAGLIVIAEGVNGEVRYLRLFLAVGLGLSILNVVGGAIAIRFGSRWVRVGSGLRFVPLLLLAATAAAVLSRWTGLDPPVVAGVLAGAVFAASTPVRQRAMVNLLQVGAIMILGLGGWLAHALLGPADGFWASVASETTATLCLAGLGSALVLVLPIATLPGRVILEWSLPAWIATVLVVSSGAAAVFYGQVIAMNTLVPWMLAASIFAALSVAIWAFVRFVEPRLA